MYKAVIASTLIGTASAATFTKAEKPIADEYIIRLPNRFEGNLRNFVGKMQERLGSDMVTKYVYDELRPYGFVAYSAKLTATGLNATLMNGDIAAIEENQEANIFDCTTQSDPDWGIARTNQRGTFHESASQTYYYSVGQSGSNVDAYIVDTGIYCENNDFVNKETGSCSCGIDVVDGSCVDGNGHGTHCAGTVAGQTYGVAKEANLIAVRVLNAKGSGSYDDIVEGINWMVGNAKTTGRRSVANLSLGGSYSEVIDDATAAAVESGIFMAVAAGNSDAQACKYSPASTASAFTVGATDPDDGRASYSNYGECLDIFGPGTDITSAWIGSPDATNTISGTSMATPHVAGVAAKYLSVDNTLSVAELSKALVDNATEDVLTGVDGGFFPSDANKSPNLMVYGYCT